MDQQIIAEHSEYRLCYHVILLFSCVYLIYFVTGCLHSEVIIHK